MTQLKYLLFTGVLIAIFYVFKTIPAVTGGLLPESVFLTGIILLASYLFATSLKKVKLPRLTGYMLLGIIIGPMGLNFLGYEMLEQLKIIENLAISFIAITAGGELKFSRFRSKLKSIGLVLGGQILTVFFGLLVLTLILADYIPFLAKFESTTVMGLALLFAGTAVSLSPATVIGIVTELNAKGRVTQLILAITVINSILIVIFFPVIMTLAKFYISGGSEFNFQILTSLLLKIVLTFLVGIAIGIVVIFYLKKVSSERALFLIGVATVISELNTLFSFDILLVSMIVGIVVDNFSEQGDTLINEVERSSLPLYILFFCFAGAALHLDTMREAFIFTFFLVLARMGLFFIGSYAGGRLAGETQHVQVKSWLGFVGQAGIAIGLATIVQKAIPGPIGQSFKTILIASVVINELIGPILLKYLLINSKESNR